MIRFACLLLLSLWLVLPAPQVRAQTLDSRNFRIEWKVVNRFRLFGDPAVFKTQETAWRQYLIHVDALGLPDDKRDDLIARTSILGTEHVLNDRHIAFSGIVRKNFDWRGWAG